MRDNKLGEKLRLRREEKGITLVGLSELTGIHHTYLGRIERGTRYPSATSCVKMAGPLGYDEAELLKMAGYLSPDETDERIAKFKETLKGGIQQAMGTLLDKVDTL